MDTEYIDLDALRFHQNLLCLLVQIDPDCHLANHDMCAALLELLRRQGKREFKQGESVEQIASMVAHKLRVMLAHALYLCENRSDDGSGGLVDFSRELRHSRLSQKANKENKAWQGVGEDESSCVLEVCTFLDVQDDKAKILMDDGSVKEADRYRWGDNGVVLSLIHI